MRTSINSPSPTPITRTSSGSRVFTNNLLPLIAIRCFIASVFYEIRNCVNSLFSIDTLAKWRYRGKGPAYMKMDHAIRYSREALEQYLAKRTVPEGR